MKGDGRAPIVANSTVDLDRIELKLAEARADVAAGRVKPMDEVLGRLRGKFNVHA